MLANLRDLDKILRNLNKAGSDLPKSLETLITFPFPPRSRTSSRATTATCGCTVDLDFESLAQNLFGGTDLEGLLGSGKQMRDMSQVPNVTLPGPRWASCRSTGRRAGGTAGGPARGTTPGTATGRAGRRGRPGARPRLRGRRSADPDDGGPLVILKRGVIVQLIAFAVITVVGVAIVSVNYIGSGATCSASEYSPTSTSPTPAACSPTPRSPTGRPGRAGRADRADRGRHPRQAAAASAASGSARGHEGRRGEPVRGRRAVHRPGARDEVRALPGPGRPVHDPAEPDHACRCPPPSCCATSTRSSDSVNTEDLGVIVDELDKAFSGPPRPAVPPGRHGPLLKTANEAYPTPSGSWTTSVDRSGHRARPGRQHPGIRPQPERADHLAPQRRPGAAPRPSTACRARSTSRTRRSTRLARRSPVLLANLTTTGQVISSRKAGLRSLFILSR